MSNNVNSFQPFPKMARLSRECVITEKIDGTNAQIFVWDMAQLLEVGGKLVDPSSIPWLKDQDGFRIAAGSRNKWLTLEKNGDNYGFARWVFDNFEKLKWLGQGRHFGEWWGAGIQRRYGQTQKWFSLFNTARWIQQPVGVGDLSAACLNVGVPELRVVPTLYRGIFDTGFVEDTLELLRDFGSQAAPGFMDPEGIVIWHEAARVMFKKTIKDDEQPKSANILVDTPPKFGILSA